MMEGSTGDSVGDDLRSYASEGKIVGLEVPVSSAF